MSFRQAIKQISLMILDRVIKLNESQQILVKKNSIHVDLTFA